MPRLPLLAAVCLSATLAAAPRGHAQEWSPPSRDMPTMPLAADMRADWLGPRAPWFSGIEPFAGVGASQLALTGDRRRGSDHLQIARFSRGPVPVVVWSDRNGDGRADIIEIYKAGGVIIQLIDVDYSGQANVLRVYDARGALLREDRL